MYYYLCSKRFPSDYHYPVHIYSSLHAAKNSKYFKSFMLDASIPSGFQFVIVKMKDLSFYGPSVRDVAPSYVLKDRFVGWEKIEEA